MLNEEFLKEFKEANRLSIDIDTMNRVMELSEAVKDIQNTYYVQVLKLIRDRFSDLDEVAAFASMIDVGDDRLIVHAYKIAYEGCFKYPNG